MEFECVVNLLAIRVTIHFFNRCIVLSTW